MTNAGQQLSHAFSGRLLRSRRRGTVRFSPAGSVAARLGEVVGEPDRKRRALDEFNAIRDWFVEVAHFWPDEAQTATPRLRVRLLIKIRNVLRAEHDRGRTGHWAYAFARHDAMARQFRKMREIAKSC